MKIYKKIFFSLLFLTNSSTPQAWADETESLIHKEGKLVSIKIMKGNPVRIFVVGREEAQINLKDLTLTIRRLKPYPGKVLKLDRNGEYFEVKDKAEFERSSELEISTGIDGKTESFNVKLDKNP